MPAAYSPPISPRHIAAGGQYFQWKYPIGAPAGLVKRNISSVNIRMRKPSPRAKSEPKLKPEVRSKARAEVKPYHHGDLKPAVLAAAEKLLEGEGVDALTLRAVARMVGVSHTAPKNHFGDLEGLLSELAAVGYRRFGAALTAAMDDAGADPRQRLRAMGLAYVAFARAYPNLFVLMYRSDRLDMGEFDEVAERAVARIDPVIIRNVVTIVLAGRGLKRHQPYRGDAEPMQIVETPHKSAKIADSIGVGIHVGANRQAVHDRILVPKVVDHGVGARDGYQPAGTEPVPRRCIRLPQRLRTSRRCPGLEGVSRQIK